MVRYKDNESEKWILKDHTKIKHEILGKYLIPWARILSKYNKRLVIVDGFAGRGEYYNEKGERIINGSPIILMNLNNQSVIEELVCICIEKNVDNFSNLCKIIKERKANFSKVIEGSKYENIQIFESPPTSNLFEQMKSQTIYRHGFQKVINQFTKIFLINDEFGNIIPKAIENFLLEKETNKHRPAPGFYFIDPFGFHGISLKLIKDIMRLQKSEVLLTLMSRDINRFNELEQEEQALITLFGNTNWKNEIQRQGLQGQESFVDYYRDCLKNCGIKYVIKFKIGETDRRQSLYYLMHASNSFKAVELMKETMYYINPDYTYYGPDNEKFGKGQARLDVRTHPLREQLLKTFHGQSLSFELIREATIDTNIYIIKDYRSVLKDLEKDQMIIIERIESKKNGIKDGDIIKFI